MSQVPIVVSALSLTVAAFALGWNVYRDVVLKARLRVHVGTMGMIVGSEHRGWFIQVSGVNFGPGVLTVTSVSARKDPPWWKWPRKHEYFYVFASPLSQFGDKLPIQLGVGGRASVMLSPDLYREDWSTIGLQDTFGRTHWAPVGQYRNARKRFLEDGER